jgi:hypothetical protein
MHEEMPLYRFSTVFSRFSASPTRDSLDKSGAHRFSDVGAPLKNGENGETVREAGGVARKVGRIA